MSQTHNSDSRAPTLRPLNDAEFLLFQRFIYARAGIFLPDVKKPLLSGRLAKRIRHLNLPTFRAYFERVQEDREEMQVMLDAITTNETHFFREPRHFDFLEQVAFPQWKKNAEAGLRKHRLRLWSAACSSGEEPYSLAISLLEHFPADSGWSLNILASDISRQMLNQAQEGIWPIRRAEEIPSPLLKRYMLRGIGAQTGKMKAGNEVRQPIEFRHINLNDTRYPVERGLDAIFCRNVLIYFDQESRNRVVNRLLDYLAPDGYLFLGHAESLTGMNNRVRSLAPAVYTFHDNHSAPRLL